MRKNSLLFSLILSLSFYAAIAQTTERERPADWENLVYGGRFMDRFLYMPDLGGMTSDTWGAQCVVPRDINNGIEDSDWSYWGGNARLLKDGKYHLFVCRWRENSPKGHREWSNSNVVHAVSENSFGPYKVLGEVGKGHNPEWYITDEGKFVIYVIDGYYVSNDVNGPWAYNKFDFNTRDRDIIEGLSNLTFARREDGSFIMVCRGGGVWISKDGISAWNQLSDSRIYPPVNGRFEDPVIWKTDVQYHLIVNDWLGRIAWYMRSKDGIRWKTDPGEAYMPGIANYADGTEENWFKYERLKVLQDKYGRATQAHFAVIDTLKSFDLSNDNHSSKHITIPLRLEKRISILNETPINEHTKEIIVRVEAEDGFDPTTDMDLNSLRFGASEEVNFGRGSKVKTIKKERDNVLIIFDGEGNGITDENFAAKLLGKDLEGNLLLGYSKLPGVNYTEPVLSARKPLINSDGSEIMVEVQNFGQVSSKESSLVVLLQDNKDSVEIGTVRVPPLLPYEKSVLQIRSGVDVSVADNQHFVVIINNGQRDMVSCIFEK